MDENMKKKVMLGIVAVAFCAAGYFVYANLIASNNSGPAQQTTGDITRKVKKKEGVVKKDATKKKSRERAPERKEREIEKKKGKDTGPKVIKKKKGRRGGKKRKAKEVLPVA